MFTRRFLQRAAVSLLVALLTLNVAAQAPVEKVDLDVVAKIRAEGLERSKVMDTLSWLTDVYGPRLANSTNYKAAAEWAVKRLTEGGAQNAHLESWDNFGRGWTLDSFQLNMTKPSYAPIIAYPKAWSGSTNGIVRGKVVYLNAANVDELAKYKGQLKGAIVLLSAPVEVKAHFKAQGGRLTDEELLAMANADGMPSPGGGRGNFGANMPANLRQIAETTAKKWQMIYEEGAAIVLEPSRIGDGGTLFVSAATMPADPNTPFNQRPNVRSKDAKVIPQAVLTPEHYNRMVRILEKGVPVEMEAEVKASYQDQDLKGYNVIAEIPGTDLKDEIVMVGGHFDSWHAGTGATDNAAGSAVAIEVMRIIKTLGLQPRRTIRIGLWGGEEQGLIGSRAYVEQHFAARQPAPAPAAGAAPTGGGPGGGGGGMFGPSGPLTLKPDHAKFAGYFNLDNGTGKIRGVYLQGNEAVRSIFRAWLTPFKDLGASTITISNTGGTDHQAFDGAGLPGFQFIQDEIEYDTRTHHSNMDVYDRIQADDMKQAATIIASFVYHTAMRNEKLPRKPLPAGSR